MSDGKGLDSQAAECNKGQRNKVGVARQSNNRRHPRLTPFQQMVVVSVNADVSDERIRAACGVLSRRGHLARV